MWQAVGMVFIEVLGNSYFLGGFIVGCAVSLAVRFNYLKHSLKFYQKENSMLKEDIGRLNALLSQKEVFNKK